MEKKWNGGALEKWCWEHLVLIYTSCEEMLLGTCTERNMILSEAGELYSTCNSKPAYGKWARAKNIGSGPNYPYLLKIVESEGDLIIVTTSDKVEMEVEPISISDLRAGKVMEDVIIPVPASIALHPWNEDSLSYLPGIISCVDDDRDIIYISREGISGSPIINREGSIVGMITEGNKGYGARTILEFMERHKFISNLIASAPYEMEYDPNENQYRIGVKKIEISVP